MAEEELRKQVRKGYAKIAVKGSSCCGGEADRANRKIGYSEVELEAAPEGSNMGLGCGNPVALASLKKGETVIDLGSGGGFDCFLASKRVGENGRVIGVDMTPEMIDKARVDARKGKYTNVEFRLGEIEHLPVADNAADVIISNCVFNLAPDKKKVFKEAFRVLKPGGRLMVSDLVLLKELPEAVKAGMCSTSCVTGAMMKDKYIETIKAAGFGEVQVVKEEQYGSGDVADDPDTEVMVFNQKTNAAETRKVADLDEKARHRLEKILEAVVSIHLSATKPERPAGKT